MKNMFWYGGKVVKVLVIIWGIIAWVIILTHR